MSEKYKSLAKILSSRNIERQWLRWFDVTSRWILTPTEQERQLVEQERQRVARLIEQLRSLGVEPNLRPEQL